MTAQIHSFHGGIHPPENKRQSTGGTITEAPVPSRIVLPLQQHIGLPADPLVKVGDKVLKGQTVAEAIGRISANIHASTSGTVVAIEAHPVPHMSGMMADCIIIEADGEDQWTEHQGLEDYQQLPKPELIEYIRKAGVAGMGGAGFPTDVKLHLGDDHIVNTLIINAAECEPYITADDMLMRERADKICGGIEIIAHLLQPLHIIVGIEDNKPQAIRALHEAFDGCSLNLDIISVPTKYPSGGEKQLIKLLTGVEVPSGKIPADVGIVCQNVGTTTAVYDAVQHGKPLVSRVITITGEAVAHPQNLEARIGTPFADLLEYCGLSEQHLARLIVGGPMMGLTIENPQIPMIKTSNCLIAGSINEFPAQPPAQACIRCGMCEQVCPVELLPQQLHWFAKGREFEKAKHHNLFDCIECGACSYVCPSNIPLVQYYRFAKGEIRKEDAEQRKADHARLRFEARQARQEQEQLEKELRRKARAEEAAKSQAAKRDAVITKQASSAPSDSGEPDLKQLKTNAAVARTKLKKAEKALSNAQTKGLDGIDALQETVNQLQAKSDAAAQAYEQAQQAPAAPAVPAAPVLDIKQLKTNAAIARTKLKKAEKQLASAQEAGADNIAELEAEVKALTEKSATAEAAFKAAESGGTPAAAATAAAPAFSQAQLDDLKADVDALQGKVAKAKAAYEKAAASDSPAAPKMADGVTKLEGKLKEAEAEYQQALQANAAGTAAPPAAPAFSQAQLDDLKADVDALQGKVDKAKAAYEKAAASDSPAAPKMADGVTKLEGKLKEAEAEYQQALQANEASAATPAPAAPAFSQAQLDDLKADVDALQGKVAKAKAAYEKAAASDSPAAPKMADGVTKLEGKLKEAEAEYQQALQANTASTAAAPAPAAPTFSQAQLDDLKADVDAMQGKVEKAKAAYEKAVASESPAAPKMADGITKLEGKLKEAEAEYQQVLQANQASTSAPAPAAPAFSQAQLDDLKADADAMRSKVEKAKAAYEKAVASESPAAAKMADGVAKLEGKLKEADAEYQQALQANAASTASPDATAVTINNVAAEKPDAKALKQQVSIMRTKLKKAEKALDEADDSNRENLQQDVANLTARYEQARNELASLEAEHIAAAAAEGIDLKQLKVDAALARAAVTKAERALSKAEEDMQTGLQAELLSAQEKAAELNSTLERFSK